MRFFQKVAGFTLVLGMSSWQLQSAACGTAPPECGPIGSGSGLMLPANSSGIRVETPFGGYRVDPDGLELTVDRGDGAPSEVEIAVSESEPGVYEIVPEPGFEPMSTYTLSSTLVRVEGFTFEFHSPEQVVACLQHFRRKILPTGRLPRDLGGGDHWEFQRWYERLPAGLRREAKRPKVVAALEEAARKIGVVAPIDEAVH
jgi:hypothetical protein